MASRRKIELSAGQRSELERIVASDPKNYMRERAAAILKVADGKTAHAVARDGLLCQRDPDTVYTWLDRYQAAGIAGLRIHSGRGRKPAFSPSVSIRP